MTAWVEGDRGFFLGCQAQLIDNDREVAAKAWFSDKVKKNPAHRFIVGRFVEAGSVNKNKHLFTLEGLQMGRPSIEHAPLNINHVPRRVIGAFVGAELIYPTAAPAQAVDLSNLGVQATTTSSVSSFTYASNTSHLLLSPSLNPLFEPVTAEVDAVECDCDCDDPATCACKDCPNSHKDPLEEKAAETAVAVNPHIEALAVVWKYYFPNEFAEVEMAHQEGRLFYSMECVPERIKCSGDTGCGESYEYHGRQSDEYCDHLNESASVKELIKPHFTGGAAVIPPEVPAWADADVYALVAKHSELAETIYEQVKTESPHLSPREWEAQMAVILQQVQ